MSLSVKQKFVLLSAAIFLVGFALGKGAVGLYMDLMERPYTFSADDEVRREPSVMAPMVYNYYTGGKNEIIDKLEMSQPTAGRMLRSRAVELKDGTKVFLAQDDVYKISAEKAEPGKCYVTVKNHNDEAYTVAIAREDIEPLDEGTWALVKNERGKTGWVRLKSNW